MKETKLIQVQPADLSELNRVIDWEVQFLLVERPKREAVVVAGRCRAGAWRAAQPGGVYSSAAATAAGSPRDGDEDRLYSVGQRFSYFGVGRAPGPAAGAGRRRAAAPFAPAARRGARPRATRRPRMTCGCAGARVLLKCRSNLQRELGERGPVGGRPGGRGRGSARLAAPGPGRPGQPPGAGAAGDPGAEDPAAAVVETRRPSPRPLFSENQRDNQPRMGSPPGQGDGKLCTTTLIPKLSRLQSAHSPAARQRVAAAAGGTHKISWWAGTGRARRIRAPPRPAPPPLCAAHQPAVEASAAATVPCRGCRPPLTPARACSPAPPAARRRRRPALGPLAAPRLAPLARALARRRRRRRRRQRRPELIEMFINEYICMNLNWIPHQRDLIADVVLWLPEKTDDQSRQPIVQVYGMNQLPLFKPVCGGAGGRMVLRKKRSVGSMEDLWDESVFEAEAKRARAAPSPTFALGPAPPATPVIKISFGRQNPVTLLCP
ncbi:Protein of unknown function [Gryllus bimaculatus]|nr:Protein of unknown function [Gryllus bimaculatus]